MAQEHQMTNKVVGRSDLFVMYLSDGGVRGTTLMASLLACVLVTIMLVILVICVMRPKNKKVEPSQDST